MVLNSGERSPSGATDKHKDDIDPIDGIWNYMKNKVPACVTKDMFFGLEPMLSNKMEITRIGSISACHLILNMVGFHPDKGLPKREKIRNIMSDGEHIGYGSLCPVFLTSDFRMFKKAQAIYKYRNFNTKVIHVPYKPEGMSVTLVEPGSIRKIKLAKPE